MALCGNDPHCCMLPRLQSAHQSNDCVQWPRTLEKLHVACWTPSLYRVLIDCPKLTQLCIGTEQAVPWLMLQSSSFDLVPTSLDDHVRITRLGEANVCRVTTLSLSHLHGWWNSSSSSGGSNANRQNQSSWLSCFQAEEEEKRPNSFTLFPILPFLGNGESC